MWPPKARTPHLGCGEHNKSFEIPFGLRVVFTSRRNGVGCLGVISYLYDYFFDFVSIREVFGMTGNRFRPLGPGEGGSEGVWGAPKPFIAIQTSATKGASPELRGLMVSLKRGPRGGDFR